MRVKRCGRNERTLEERLDASDTKAGGPQV